MNQSHCLTVSEARSRMTATFLPGEFRNARNLSCDRETINRLRLVVFSAADRKRDDSPSLDSGFSTIVDARFYMGRSSQAQTVYCSVWIHSKGLDRSGYGSAGGYGYHKESQAFADALRSAGVTFKGSRADIGGAGDTAMVEALQSIGRACGVSDRTPSIVL